MFYLMSRGHSEEETLAMIVNGFFEPFTRELPMEYAVELNKLMTLKWKEASVDWGDNPDAASLYKSLDQPDRADHLWRYTLERVHPSGDLDEIPIAASPKLTLTNLDDSSALVGISVEEGVGQQKFCLSRMRLLPLSFEQQQKIRSIP